jgi:hypothetical protein
MVYSPKLTFVANNNNSIGVGLTLGKTIRFGSLKFIADRFSNLSLYLEGNHSGVVFVGMVHSGLSFVHTMNKESSNDGDTALGGGVGGSSRLPGPRGCNVVTLIALSPPHRRRRTLRRF